MGSKIKIVKNEDLYNITNLRWDEYKLIMVAMETTQKVLAREIDCSHNFDKKRVIENIVALYLNLQEDGIPFKGEAIGLDENIIDCCLQQK